ncbi:hypothetical protein GVN16_15045 [Emticicia sp. CRIBPO]|uniref:acyltransferase n=1 Tax=Emticicia sp. CRIBPO TaxID=2683258 RepID=UPI001412A113|nr:acyltransferase [Emticicia sp. CRIBPO]NBA87086.1 hypothetical protein [Emticicia sp. CRIBPO]
MISKLLSTVYYLYRGEKKDFEGDLNARYFGGFILRNGISFARGFLTFRKSKLLIGIGRNVTVRCASKFQFSGNAVIHDGCYVDAYSENGIVLGKNVSIGKNSHVECSGSIHHKGVGLIIGDNVGIGSFSLLGCAGGISIGNDTIMGNFVSLHSENHNYADLNVPIRLQGVSHQGIKIGENCWIGSKVTILDGANIESGCIIAAGAVVVAGTYKENSIYGGVPAKLIKSRN